MKLLPKPVLRRVLRRSQPETLMVLEPSFTCQMPSLEGMPAGSRKYKTIVQRLKGSGNVKVGPLKGVQIIDLHSCRAMSGPNEDAESVYMVESQVQARIGSDGKTLYFMRCRASRDPHRSSYSPQIEETLRAAMSLTYGVLKDADDLHISKPELFLKVSNAFAAEAKTEQKTQATEDSWQALLLEGLERKKALLKSSQFKSVTEVADILDVKEPAVRRRIREYKLFALKTPGTDEYRIPVWALAINQDQTKDIHAASGDMDAWSLHHFMTTPNSWLNGLKPLELLLAPDSLNTEQLARRREVAQHFGAADSNALLDVVLKALAQEVAEESEA